MPEPLRASLRASLRGLVLTGGASTRMGQDKATLVYGHAPQWRAVAALLAQCGAEVFWSCTAAQAAAWELGDRALFDLVPGHGPASGLHAAFSRAPEGAWLVVGCDYPHLEAPDLQRLIDARAPAVEAVTYQRDATAEIEPLLSLWEPAAQAQFLHAFAAGDDSPRRALRRCALQVLTPRTPHVLVNQNTPRTPNAPRMSSSSGTL
jgi:molybdopterin-guanine dinucleotide biosynthesis protein A